MFLNEFTTTAMCRPDILEKTYESFSKNIKDVDFKKCVLYINIDPAPDVKKISDVVNVAKKYFGDVVINVPSSCNFCSAVKWCFSRPNGKYFFHLEDDWILLREISLENMIKILEEQNRIGNGLKYVSILLRAYAVKSDRICLAPSVVCSDFAKRVCAKLDIKFNPEEQMRSRNRAFRKSGQNEFSLRYPFPSTNDIIIKDIGREWLKNNNIVGDKFDKFVRWKRW